MTHDLRLEFRTRNNALWHAIFDTCKTVAEFCRRHGLDQVSIGALLNLKRSPYRRGILGTKSEPGLVPQAQRLCEITGLSEYELFPPDLYAGLFPTTGVAELESSRFVALTAAKRLALPPTQEDELLAEERKAVLNAAIATLKPREQQVLRARFGLTEDGDTRTLQELGDTLGVNRERVRQIEASAMRKLRHPARRLRPFRIGG